MQLYVRDLVGSVTRPVRELKGFRRLRLEPGQKIAVEFKLHTDDLAFYVFSSVLAASLNRRVDVAHTAVSRLGTMLSTLRRPAKLCSDTSSTSLSTSVKGDAVMPVTGKVP